MMGFDDPYCGTGTAGAAGVVMMMMLVGVVVAFGDGD